MKRSSGTLAFLRIFVGAVLVIAGLGYYAHVRAQSNDFNPSGVGSVVVPLRPLAPLSSVPVPPVFGLEGIVADKTAAIELGKALFWDMQAGSDDIQACASCHFNAGADSRAINQVNPGSDGAFQLGVNVNGSIGPNYHYKAGTPGAGFGGYHDGDFPFRKLANVNDPFSVISDTNDVSGSQGIFPLTMGQIVVGRQQQNGHVVNNSGSPHAGDTNSSDDSNDSDTPTRTHNPGSPTPGTANNSSSTKFSTSHGSSSDAGGSRVSVVGSNDVTSAEIDNPVVDPVFSYPDPANPGARIDTRRTGGRNAPSVVDAVFNFRNFWDGRAQNVCNGNNPFGARDKTAHLAVMEPDGTLGAALVSMENSALCSQSLGPILSNAEMSADGRNLSQVGRKLLVRKPLAKQFVDPTDSVLGAFSAAPANGLKTTYPTLIEKAFQPEWWNFNLHVCEATDGSIAATINPDRGRCPNGTTEYSQMEYNFSLFWGVAIQMYESTLIADQTPLDQYLEQQQTYTLVGDNLTNQYTIQLKPGVTPYTVSIVGLNPTLDFSDQDTYAFDNGQGIIGGAGVNNGTIDYASGTLIVSFGDPPVSAVPIKISYSVGPTPMTQGQLRGLYVFQTKGQCVVCHGGPELSNATVGTAAPVPVERMIMEDDTARIYDTGFYHIGVRPTAEDAGLGGTDPVAGMPLSQAEVLRQDACKGGFETVIVPGRRGDGIGAMPMTCSDEIARAGFFKAPQLRNVALTAPYFHNGSRLTLEQVVEFYNRGGDFNTVDEEQYMDPDITQLALTRQDEEDLVDFLRNGLTDARTVKQAAPFDHPQLFTPNGHATDSNGYPVKDPQHPAQAITNLMEVPATGANGGKPLPTFLDNMLGVSNANPR